MVLRKGPTALSQRGVHPREVNRYGAKVLTKASHLLSAADAGWCAWKGHNFGAGGKPRGCCLKRC